MSPIGFTGFAEADFDHGVHTSWRQRLRSELLTVLDRHLGTGGEWRLHATRARGGLYLDRGAHEEDTPGFWLGLDAREFWLRFRLTRHRREDGSLPEAWQRFLAALRRPGSPVQQHISSSLQLGYYFIELYGSESRPLVVLGPGANSRALLTALDAYPDKSVLHLYITRRWPRMEAVARGALIVADIVETIAWLMPVHQCTWVPSAVASAAPRRSRVRQDSEPLS